MKYIAAIEIGSSRIKGIVASVDDTAAITVLAVEELDSGETVRYGRVQNAREVSLRVNEIIQRLENSPKVAPGRISAVFVANGGRSLASAFAEATVKLGGEAEITDQTLQRLHKEARYNLATDREVLAIAPRRFSVDGAEVKKIIGAFGNVVRGEFTILTASPENRRALDRVKIESQGNDIPRDYVTRLLAQTEMALSDSDRQVGCVYIDFGAETTTIAVFREGALLMAATLPMGSANITRDLCAGLSITAETAENIKISKGKAVVERVNIQAPDDETREIINYVSARAGEIVANINNCITQAGFKAADLAAGVVLSGGGARLNGFAEMLEAQMRMKVRRAAVDASILAADNRIKPADHFDIIALVKYAAAHSAINCLDLPAQPEKAEETLEEPRQRVVAAAARTAAPGRRRDIDLDDPDLLRDDEDEVLEQPDNVNEDGEDPDDLPEQGPDAETTRATLLERLKNWFAPKVDDNDMD